MKKLIYVLAILSVLICSAAPQTTQEEKEAFKFADKLIKKMTLKEKLGQLQQFTTRRAVLTGPNGAVLHNAEDRIRLGEVGSFLSSKTSEELLKMQKMCLLFVKFAIYIHLEVR